MMQTIPTPFLYVYDEAWSIASKLAPTFDALLDAPARVLPDIWAWYIAEGCRVAGPRTAA